jgi:hypothetical protein
VINFSGFFGGIAFVATFFGLYKTKWYKLIWFGIFCLVMGTITIIIYKSRVGLIYLPSIQKATLMLCLTWIAAIDIYMKKQTAINN